MSTDYLGAVVRRIASRAPAIAPRPRGRFEPAAFGPLESAHEGALDVGLVDDRADAREGTAASVRPYAGRHPVGTPDRAPRHRAAASSPERGVVEVSVDATAARRAQVVPRTARHARPLDGLAGEARADDVDSARGETEDVRAPAPRAGGVADAFSRDVAPSSTTVTGTAARREGGRVERRGPTVSTADLASASTRELASGEPMRDHPSTADGTERPSTGRIVRAEAAHRPAESTTPAAATHATPAAAVSPRSVRVAVERRGNARPVAAVPTSAAPAPSTVEVTIGRIEVRAVAPPAARSERRAPAPAVMTLAEFLDPKRRGVAR